MHRTAAKLQQEISAVPSSAKFSTISVISINVIAPPEVLYPISFFPLMQDDTLETAPVIRLLKLRNPPPDYEKRKEDTTFMLCTSRIIGQDIFSGKARITDLSLIPRLWTANGALYVI